MENSGRELAENTGFWKDTLERQLLTVEQLEQCLQDIPEEKRTADKIENRLARLAVHHKFLTLWQAQRILTRRAASLQFEKYQLIDTLGQGGMGRVFLAIDKRLNRQVAIKVLNPDRANHQRSLARFEREAQVGGQLQHENLVRIYDVGLYNQSPYLVMEYIEGPTVSQLMEKSGCLEEAQAARIGRDVALGLQHLAEKRMVHRDVNPRNILIDMEGRAKLTDLGLAIFEEQQAQVTTEGSTVGTFDYISPEQARHSHGVDIRSDIYSLGCTLYHMISGRVPFPAGSLPEKIYAHQAKDPQPITELAPRVSREMVRIITKCMSKRPEERFETARELADRLARLVTADAQVKTVDFLRHSSSEIPAASQFELVNPLENRPDGNTPDVDAGREISWDGVNPPPKPGAGDIQSDPDAIKIDLGRDSLELPFRAESSRTTAERSASIEHFLFKPKTLLTLFGAAFVTVLVFFLVQRGFDSARPKTANRTNKEQEKAKSPVPVPAAHDVILKYADGTELPCESLADALRRASGQSAEILLASSDKPWNWPVTDNNPIVGPKLVVRCRDAEVVRLVIDLSKSQTGLHIRSGATLELVGLSIEATGYKPDSPVIQAVGNLNLQQCWMIHRDAQKPGPVAIRADSGTLTIEKSWLHGFATALKIQTTPTTKVSISNSLLSTSFRAPNAPAQTKNSVPDQTKNAASIVSHALVSLNYPQTNVDRATFLLTQSSFIGSDAFAITGSKFTGSLGVTVNRCLFQSDLLIKNASSTAQNDIPIRWNGDNNLFDLKVGFFQKSDGKSATTKLADWESVMIEKNSVEHPVPLTNPLAQFPKPSDFQPKNDSDKFYGYR